MATILTNRLCRSVSRAKLCCDFNNIRVRSFILNGAPIKSGISSIHLSAPARPGSIRQAPAGFWGFFNERSGNLFRCKFHSSRQQSCICLGRDKLKYRFVRRNRTRATCQARPNIEVYDSTEGYKEDDVDSIRRSVGPSRSKQQILRR